MTGYSPGKPSVDDEIEQLAQESSNTYSEFWNSKWTSAIPTTHFFSIQTTAYNSAWL